MLHIFLKFLKLFSLVHNWFLTCLFVGIPWEEDSVGLEER